MILKESKNTPENTSNNINNSNELTPKTPNTRSRMRNWDEEALERKETQIFERKKSDTDKEQSSKLKHFTLNSHVLNKKKKNLFERKTKCEKISDFMLKLFENIYFHIFILLCSVFTLLQEDLKILALPLTVDQPFYRVNEFIFFLFVLEFFVISICKKNFRGSFYFYLDVISIVSMIPDVHLIWDPIVDLMENSSSTIKEILGNSYFAKGSKASQAGAKASKYLRILRMINFIKLVRVTKVLQHTNQIEKKIEEKKNYKTNKNIKEEGLNLKNFIKNIRQPTIKKNQNTKNKFKDLVNIAFKLKSFNNNNNNNNSKDRVKANNHQRKNTFARLLTNASNAKDASETINNYYVNHNYKESVSKNYFQNEKLNKDNNYINNYSNYVNNNNNIYNKRSYADNNNYNNNTILNKAKLNFKNSFFRKNLLEDKSIEISGRSNYPNHESLFVYKENNNLSNFGLEEENDEYSNDYIDSNLSGEVIQQSKSFSEKNILEFKFNDLSNKREKNKFSNKINFHTSNELYHLDNLKNNDYDNKEDYSIKKNYQVFKRRKSVDCINNTFLSSKNMPKMNSNKTVIGYHIEKNKANNINNINLNTNQILVFTKKRNSISAFKPTTSKYSSMKNLFNEFNLQLQSSPSQLNLFSHAQSSEKINFDLKPNASLDDAFGIESIQGDIYFNENKNSKNFFTEIPKFYSSNNVNNYNHNNNLNDINNNNNNLNNILSSNSNKNKTQEEKKEIGSIQSEFSKEDEDSEISLPPRAAENYINNDHHLHNNIINRINLNNNRINLLVDFQEEKSFLFLNSKRDKELMDIGFSDNAINYNTNNKNIVDLKTKGMMELDCLHCDFDLNMEEFKESKNLAFYSPENKMSLRTIKNFEANENVSENHNSSNFYDEFLPENRNYFEDDSEIDKSVMDKSKNNNFYNKNEMSIDYDKCYKNKNENTQKNEIKENERLETICVNAVYNTEANLITRTDNNNKINNKENSNETNKEILFVENEFANYFLSNNRNNNSNKLINDDEIENHHNNNDKEIDFGLSDLKVKEDIKFKNKSKPKAFLKHKNEKFFNNYKKIKKRNIEEITPFTIGKINISKNNFNKNNINEANKRKSSFLNSKYLLSKPEKQQHKILFNLDSENKTFNNNNTETNILKKEKNDKNNKNNKYKNNPNTMKNFTNNKINNEIHNKEHNLNINIITPNCGETPNSESLMKTNTLKKTKSDDLQNKKSNLKLDKKLTQKFTNRLVIIINLIVVPLTILDLDFIFDLVHPTSEQANFRFICLDLLYLYMNLTVNNPQKYFPAFNATFESCFYASGYLPDYPLGKNQVDSMPENLEFFMRINFTKLKIFDEFNSKTNNFFANKILELNGTSKVLKSRRESHDYYVERYYFTDEEDYVTFLTNEVHITKLTHTLDMLKSIFVAFILIYGNLVFASDINFYIISPIENLFKRLNLIFNAIDIVECEKMKEEKYLNNGKDGISNADEENFLSVVKKQQQEAEEEQENNFKEPNLIKKKKNIFSRFIGKSENKSFLNKDILKKKVYEMLMGKYVLDKILNGELKMYNANTEKKLKNNNNNYNENEENNKNLAKEEKKAIIKTAKDDLEINKIDFSLIKLLNMISTILGYPLLLVIPNCDLETNLKLNFKSNAVKFEGFALMLKFSGLENLFAVMGAKAAKYVNMTLMLFHAIGIIFMGEPYKTDDMDFLVWKKNKNNWTKSISRYINGINKQLNMTVKSYEEENEELNKLFISQEKNDYYSEVSGNLACLAALRFLNVFLKNMKKTLKVFQDCKVTISLFADYGMLYQGYKGTAKKFNQIILGKPISRIKEISKKISSKETILPCLFISEKMLNHLDENITKNVFLYEILHYRNKNKNLKVFKHFINYKNLIKDNKNMSLKDDFYVDSISNEHLTKTVVINESLYIQQILGKEIKDFLSFLRTDVFYEEIISGFNINFKNKYDCAMENFENFEFELALKNLNELVENTFKDSNNDGIIYNKSYDDNNNKLKCDGDLVINEKMKFFIQLFKNILAKKIDLRNYTKEI